MTDEQVMAYVDGELDAAARAAFEARLKQDPALQATVAREQRLRQLLGKTYAPVLDEPVPERLSALLKPSAPVVSLAEVRERKRMGWSQWGGMAASLMLGTLLGYKVLPTEGSDPFIARGAVASALDKALSGQQENGVTPGISFIAKTGAFCRSFSTDTMAGLACREGRQWRMRQLEPSAAEPATAYRTASTAYSPALLQSIDALREGDVLDAKAEQQARDKHWQK